MQMSQQSVSSRMICQRPSHLRDFYAVPRDTQSVHELKDRLRLKHQKDFPNYRSDS
uniref:Uncharacterized protein n=1 Tax=Timema monikensis TaxID=170555 RepID=A0A7R9ELA5_9NEOP|nr:unnamed protein product [Timema monikensis]